MAIRPVEDWGNLLRKRMGDSHVELEEEQVGEACVEYMRLELIDASLNLSK